FDGVGDHLLDEPRRIFLAIAALRIVLRRYNDLRAPDRLTVHVTDRDLTLGVGLQVVQLTRAAFLGQHLQDLVREVDRRRHERVLLVDFALGAGEAEHHTLVAGAFFLTAFFLLGVYPHGDVGRLAVQQHLYIRTVIRESVLVVADVPDDI